jgi:hypothetical protein
MMPEIECTHCGWQGYIADLLCTDEDFGSSQPVDEIIFNICPDCGSVDTEDYEG